MKKYILILTILLIGCVSASQLTPEDHKRMEDQLEKQREIDRRINDRLRNR